MNVKTKKKSSLATKSSSAPRTRGGAVGQRSRNSDAKRRRKRVENLGIDSTQTSYLGRQETVVSNKEYVMDVLSSDTFEVTTLDLNPGLVQSFPWLSKQAAAWEKYRFEQLEVMYIPRVSAFADDGKSGIVALQFDYDAADAPPTSKVEMLSSRPNIDDLPCKSMRLAISAAEMNKRLADSRYVRANRPPAGTDIRWYDAGKLNIATEGQMHDGTKIGEIHFTYRVKFEVPEYDAFEFTDPKDLFFAYGAASNEDCQIIANESGEFDVDVKWMDVRVNTLPAVVSNVYGTNAGIQPNQVGWYRADFDFNLYPSDPSITDHWIREFWITPLINGVSTDVIVGDRFEWGEQDSTNAGSPAITALLPLNCQRHLHGFYIFKLIGVTDVISFKLHAMCDDYSTISPKNIQFSCQLTIVPL